MRITSLRQRPWAAAIGLLAMAGLVACGSTGPSRGGAGSDSDAALVWAVSGGSDKIYKQSVVRYNKASDGAQLTMQLFQNDPYKQKLRVAMGASRPPDVFFGWGGGILDSYVQAGDVHDLSAEMKTDDWQQRFFPNVMDAVTFDDKVYGVPMNGVQPVLVFYNKDVFREHGAQPPETWPEFVALVKKFKSAGVQPVALGGASKWPNLMYEEYLVDRIGGPQVFKDVLAGKPDAWSHPAFLKANTMIRDLVDQGAFGKGFASVDYDIGQQSALLYTGKAAMEVMGTWEFASILDAQPDFIEKGKLGWAAFPTVPGGKGDPANIVGNPANFYSVSQKSTHKDAAVDYLRNGMDDTYIDALIGVGQVPPVTGIDEKFADADNGEWLNYVYDTTESAPSFQMSWDQALPPDQAEALLTNLDQLFLKKITPQQFSDNMNKTLA